MFTCRGGASTLVGFALLGLAGLFLWFTWSSLADQTLYPDRHFGQIERDLLGKLPPWARDTLGQQGEGSVGSRLAPYGVAFVRSVANAAIVFVLAFILTLYLLIEGHRTYLWLLAFVPPQYRARADQTARDSRLVMFGYVTGNVATSIFAAGFVLVALSILKVPAALLLAVVAGVCDFVPVLGFILSAVPAVLLALTVSARTAVIVLVCYGAYHVIENYLIAPRVYGNRLQTVERRGRPGVRRGGHARRRRRRRDRAAARGRVSVCRADLAARQARYGHGPRAPCDRAESGLSRSTIF